MFGHNLRVDCQRYTPAPPFNSGANAASVSVPALPVQCHYSAGTDVSRFRALKQPTIECLTLRLTRGMNRITLSYCSSGDYPTRDSRAAFEQKTGPWTSWHAWG